MKYNRLLLPIQTMQILNFQNAILNLNNFKSIGSNYDYILH